MSPRQLLALILLPNLTVGVVVCVLAFWKPEQESKFQKEPDGRSAGNRSHFVSQDADRTSVGFRSTQSVDFPPASGPSANSNSLVEGKHSAQSTEKSTENAASVTVANPVNQMIAQPSRPAFNRSLPPTTLQKPLAFMIDMSKSSLTAEDREKLNAIKSQFNESVGGAYAPDLSNPQSIKQWRNAMSQSDQLFRTLFGWGAYADLVNSRARQTAGF